MKYALFALLAVILLIVLPRLLRGLNKAKDTVVEHRHEIVPKAKELGATVRDQARDGAARARESAQPAMERGLEKGAELGRTAMDKGRTAAEQARAKLEDVSEGSLGRVGSVAGDAAATIGLRAKGHVVFARTMLIGATLDRARPIVEAAVERAALLDPVAPAAGEAAAWLYQGTGDARLALAADGEGRCLLGCTSFEYLYGEPQGGPAIDEAMSKAQRALTEAAITVADRTRTFSPGEADTSDGIRTAPLV